VSGSPRAGGTPQGRLWRGQSPQERREARRRRLLDAALELFATTGYAATSLTALCARAGVSPRHFYELYAGREALMADLYDEIVLETAARVDRAFAAAPLTASARISAGLAAAIAHQTDDPRRARVVHLEAVGVSSWLEQHRRRVIARFAAGTVAQYRLLVEDGQLVDRPFEQVATALIGAFDGLLVHWLLSEPRTPPQDLLPAATEVFLAVLQRRAVPDPST
jgi:AcrR family transcriptional regulator